MNDIDPSSHRIPPHNIDAERAVLGAVMLENLSLGAVLDVIEAADFYLDAHRKIFSQSSP